MQSIGDSSKWLAVTLSSDAFITSLSPGAERIIGYSPQELVGRPLTQILANSTAFELSRMMDAAEKWGYWNGEIIHQARSGNHLKTRGTLALLSGHENNTSRYLLISSLNGSLALGAVEDAALEEVAAKLRSFAHEINNPLAVIMGFAQLLILNENCPGKVRSDIEKIFYELKQVIHLVDKLHAYAIALGRDAQRVQAPADIAVHADE